METGLLPPKIEASLIGVTNTSDLSDDQIKEGLQRISAFEQVADWWAGDLIAELAARHPHLVEKKKENTEQLEFEFIRHLAAYEVAAAIPLDHRDVNLSFTHHREIANECKSLAEIDEWLAKAAENEWTLAELRKRLRKRNVDPSKTGKVTGELSWLEPLTTTISRVLKKPASEYSEKERGTLRGILKPVVEFYDGLIG